MNYKEIQELVKLVNKSKVSELKIDQGDFKIVIRKESDSKQVVMQPQYMPTQMPMQQMQMQPAQQQAPQVAQDTNTVSNDGATPQQVEDTSHLIEIKSPMIGTFYRAAGPDKDPYVSIGSIISEGDTICMVEAMKLFNEIEAEVSGKIVKILVEDATPVEFDQPLFLVDPKG